MKSSQLRQIIKEEILKTLTEGSSVDPMALADALVQKGLVKDEWVYIPGKRAHASLGFEVKEILDSLKGSNELNENVSNYMFFQNLKTIKQIVDELLTLDERMVDMILADGHNWAEDHIATSKDDIEEVHNFLMSKKVPMEVDEKKLSPKQKKIAQAAPPEDKITGADFAALRTSKN